MNLCDSVAISMSLDSQKYYLAKVQNTYISSFPQVERRDFLLFCELLENEPLFKLFVILRNEQYSGFITCWEFPEFVYVEHFAIDESQRSGGIGSIAMMQFLELIDKPVVLEVEKVIDDLTARRVRFYEALGFTMHPDLYKQPPYRGGDSWFDMKLMSIGSFDLSSKYESVKDCIYTHVYNVKKLD
ncbi:GNAT family N-acetyltransferase [Massilibacteroides sp.]|uniref:GNAT family N-acetyltransferase n=1 Tax=Massilibacteroides sp. TaxID=2034766 RepID=UPI0026370483|nr:GNAT family N-acetyltransferase [Massilibacteroides sp.]MDD4513931.1 GNAT family N-acetyltransferase [Massilibacteroides sp.]